jgi:hypothetical protein
VAKNGIKRRGDTIAEFVVADRSIVRTSNAIALIAGIGGAASRRYGMGTLERSAITATGLHETR